MRFLLGAAAFAVICGLASYAIGRSSNHAAPLTCSVDALPTSVREERVAIECGAPYTSNVYFIDGRRIDQWVYDAGTFLWFEDGTLRSYKVDSRHVPDAAKAPRHRDPMVFCY